MQLHIYFKWFHFTLYTFLILFIDIPSVKKKTKTPAQNKTVMVTSKCVIPLEPLVFNGNSGTPVKRRASRSIPDESSVTSKKSRGYQGAKKTKGPLNSPRQRYGMNYHVLFIHVASVTAVFWGKNPNKKITLGQNPDKATYLTQQIYQEFLMISFYRILAKCQSFDPRLSLSVF